LGLLRRPARRTSNHALRALRSFVFSVWIFASNKAHAAIAKAKPLSRVKTLYGRTKTLRFGGGIGTSGPMMECQMISFSPSSGVRSASEKFIA